MEAKWKPAHVDTPGVTRYTKGHSKAEIHRLENGGAEATLKEGIFGLGTHVSSFHKSPAPDDQAILGKLEDTAHPPRFSHWHNVKGGDDHTQKYEGETQSGGKVKAEITRTDDGADYRAQAGIFGVHIEGHYFAPAPSDQDILKKISRP